MFFTLIVWAVGPRGRIMPIFLLKTYVITPFLVKMLKNIEKTGHTNFQFIHTIITLKNGLFFLKKGFFGVNPVWANIFTLVYMHIMAQFVK